jgi:hypothetical protein
MSAEFHRDVDLDSQITGVWVWVCGLGDEGWEKYYGWVGDGGAEVQRYFYIFRLMAGRRTWEISNMEGDLSRAVFSELRYLRSHKPAPWLASA